jgi:hypothetical protein
MSAGTSRALERAAGSDYGRAGGHDRTAYPSHRLARVDAHRRHRSVRARARSATGPRADSSSTTCSVRIAHLIPVTPVTSRVRRDPELRRRLHSARSDSSSGWRTCADVLVELNARCPRADRSIEETFERSRSGCSRCAGVLSREGNGYVVLAQGRPLVSYYANSIAHLLGAFEAGVQGSRRSCPRWPGSSALAKVP